jgi:hypothetical protein
MIKSFTSFSSYPFYLLRNPLKDGVPHHFQLPLLSSQIIKVIRREVAVAAYTATYVIRTLF